MGSSNLSKSKSEPLNTPGGEKMSSAEPDLALAISAKSELLQDKRCLLLTVPPPEIHNLIVKLLDPVASTCLGLTCKTFYDIHRSFHGRVPLNQESPDNGLQLHHFLDDWICQGLPLRRRISLVYSPAAEKFQDLEYIRKTVLVEIEEVQGKTKRADTEYHAILHSVTINLQLYRGTNNTGSPLVDIRELLAGATKVKEYRNLLREMEQALKQSLQFSVRLVEVKAATHGLALNDIATPKCERFSEKERPVQRVWWC